MGLFKRKKKKEDKDQVKKPEKVEVDKKTEGVKDIRTKEQKDKEKGEKKSKKEDFKKTPHQAYRYLIRPVISEKASGLGMYNQYVFEVAPKSNKIEIKKAVKSLYGVKPVKVNIINMPGKNIRYGRSFGKTKNWKKAIVTLRSGDKIDVYEGV